jgi:hypothetical protein
MDAIQTWLATSPLGGVVKVLVGTILGYVAAELPAWEGAMPVIAFLIVQGLVPIAINYLNSGDPRYGRGSDRSATLEVE